jgi:hypothetical protein
MKNYLKKFIQESKETVKILNIMFTWFENLEESVYKKIIEEGTYFEILLLKRMRKKDDTSYFSLRESDEYRHEELVRGVNRTLFSLFEFLVYLAKEKPPKGGSLIRKLQVKEYSFLPVMCAYIFDEKKIVFGPYIAKDCNFIPLVHIEKNIKDPEDEISMAFGELIDHYKILSGEKKRPNKEYIEFFSFFDGQKNCSVHEFIEHNHNKGIEEILSKNSGKYKEYLDKKTNTDFDDHYVEALGEQHSLEGRFDAVIRDIKNKIEEQ